ncbi:MAG: hypothetical protein KDD45_13980, partial [Bdellovibrionales bacterium]|nr:hypothetical protein [Bdellovibrionales bacterium]
IGDFHMLNVADIELSNNSRKIGLIDVDDVGNNVPLLIDLSRLLVASQVSPANVKIDKLLASYFKGIENNSFRSSFVQDTLKKSIKDYEDLYEAYIKHNTHNEHFDSNSEVLPIDSAPKPIQGLFSLVRKNLDQAVFEYAPQAEILDFGFRVKATGGSKGIPRFLYLIKSPDGKLEIIEFKEFVNSSAEKYLPQGSKLRRFNAAVKMYRPKEKVSGIFSLINSEGHYFIARTKLPTFVDFKIDDKMNKEDKRNLGEFTIFLSNLYGLLQRNQMTVSQQEWLLKNKDLVSAELTKFVKSYITALKKINSTD